MIKFDGLWLDLNEPTTTCNGAYPCCPNKQDQNKPYNEGNKNKIFESENNFQWYSSFINQSNISSY